MPIEQEILNKSAAVRTSWLTSQHGAPAKLPWTGFRANDESAFFRALFTLVKARKGQVAYTRSETNNLDFCGWFNYFLGEVVNFTNGNSELETNLGRIFSIMFDLKATGVGNTAKIEFADDWPLSLKANFYGLLQNAPAVVPKGILAYLFELGFEEATTVEAGDYFGRNLALKSNLPDGVAIRSAKGEYVFAYRGDTRDLAKIIQQGARCRAELDFWRRDAGLTQPWHPWNDVDQKWRRMWFRRGNKDNDYFTMNSLAHDFHISCAYPMFRSFEIDQGLRGPVSGWSEAQRRLLAAKKVSVVEVFDRRSNTWEEVLSDESRVFACAISSTTTAATTFDLNNYPESAVRNINLEDMVAWIKVRRYHRPPADAHSHYDSTLVTPSMTIRVLSWGWVRTEDETRASLGCTKDGIKAIGAKLQNMIGKCFDISHSQYFPAATYDVTRPKPLIGPQPKPKHEAVKRVGLSGW